MHTLSVYVQNIEPGYAAHHRCLRSKLTQARPKGEVHVLPLSTHVLGFHLGMQCLYEYEASHHQAELQHFEVITRKP